MEPIPGIDPFNLCWNVLFIESKQLNGTFFNKEHCSCKLIDSRDINFDVIENRLAYTYKYGCFNILLLEKCTSNFLNDVPAVEAYLPLENLKVCSLSNGPGLDVVGFLCALYKSNKHLKSIPSLRALNLFESWRNLYKLVVHSGCHMITLKSNLKYFNVPTDNISLIQGDVYSTLSAEAKNCISESNVLLMVKVFVSSKATPTVFENTLKEIFSLAKPGTLIFFVGSKQNTKRFSEMDHLKQYIKCIYGPQKVTLDNLIYSESVTNAIGTKPLDNGYADFMVWQKRDVFDVQPVTQVKRKKKRGKRKKKSKDAENGGLLDDTVIEESEDGSDAESEMSLTSESKYSDILSNDSNTSLHASPELSQDTTETFCDNTNMESSNYEKKGVNEQDMAGNKSYTASATHEIEYETAVSAEKPIMQSLNDVNQPKDLSSSEISFNVKPQLQENVLEKKVNTQNIKFETSVVADINSRILSHLDQFKLSKNTDVNQTLFDVKPVPEKKENIQDIKYETSILTGKVESSASSSVNPLEAAKSRGTSKMSLNVNSPVKKGNILEYNVSCTSTKTDSINQIFPANFVNRFFQDVYRKDNGENLSSKRTKDKTKNLSSELQANNGNKSQSKAASQKITLKSQSCESLCNRNATSTEDTRPSDNGDVQALIQKCESLVTSLEKLTTEIKQDISSSKDANCVRMCCSTGQACGHCRAYNFHTNCASSSYRCCCRQVCGCQMTQNSCRSCTFSRESSVSRFGTGRPTNISGPYITIPLENEDLLRILTLRK